MSPDTDDDPRIITIAGRNYTGLAQMDMTAPTTIPQHPVEDQYEVADHAHPGPETFSASVFLFEERGDLDALQALQEHRTRFLVITRWGHYPDCMIESIRLLGDSSETGIPATVKFKRVRTAVSRLTTIAFEVPAAKEEMPGSTVAQAPPTKEVDRAPRKPRDGEEWIDVLMEHSDEVDALKEALK